MSDPELICEVRANDGIYRDWTSVSVSWAADRDVREFRLQLAEPSGGKGKGFSSIRLKPGDTVDIVLAGIHAVKGGRIVSRQTGYDAARHVVQVDGFSKSGEIHYTSAQPAQYRGYSLEAIARAQLKPLGIDFVMKDAPLRASLPFRNVVTHYGETVGELIRRLATQRDVFLSTDVEGNIVAGLPKPNTGITLETLAEGRNILSASCMITDLGAAGKVEYSTQDKGSDERHGSNAAEVKTRALVPGVASDRTWLIVGDGPGDQREAQMANDAAVRKMLLDLMHVTIVHKGWLKPGTAQLWDPGEWVTVKSPMLFPVGDGKIDLRVFDVTCSQDSETGTTTTVSLRNQRAWEERFPSAKADDKFYSQGASPAVAVET